MTVITEAQSAAMRAIVRATLDTIREAGPQGAPAGALYIAMQAHGCTKANFDTLMDLLVSSGSVTRDGLVYRSVV